MAERDILQQVLDDPVTIGEKEQSERLRRVSADSNDIRDLRKKLQSIKSDLLAAEIPSLQSNAAASKGIEFPSYERRCYDNSILKEKPVSAIGKIFSYNQLKRAFRQKYGRNKHIQWSLWQFILNGELFFPAPSVSQFVQRLIVHMEDLKEPFREMHAKGWLDDKGADMLSPKAFNLLGEAERLVYDESIFNLLIYNRQPHLAIKKINSFLGYYFSLTRDGRTIASLLDAIKQSARHIVFRELDEAKRIIREKLILENIELILSRSIEDEFIVPLFECAYMRCLTITEIRRMIAIADINENEYRASASLIALMAGKKKRHDEQLASSRAALLAEIAFITDLQKTIDSFAYNRDDISGDLLDYLLFISENKNEGDFNSRKNNLASYIGALCTLFALIYESMLTEGVNIRIGQEMRRIQIFHGSLFGTEIGEIRINKRLLEEYTSKGYGIDLLKKEMPLKDEQLCIGIVNAINDSFYSLGEKLYRAVAGHASASSGTDDNDARTITEDNIGKVRIPCADRQIIRLYAPNIYRYTLSDKKIIEAILEVKRFCINFCARFEYRFRDFSKSSRRESITAKLEKIPLLKEHLEKLDHNS